jgi:hypothetical protein
MADANDPIKRGFEAERLLKHPMVAEAREHMRESLARSAWRRQHFLQGRIGRAGGAGSRAHPRTG